jgi:hypothetical protein
MQACLFHKALYLLSTKQKVHKKGGRKIKRYKKRRERAAKR